MTRDCGIVNQAQKSVRRSLKKTAPDNPWAIWVGTAQE